MANYTRKAIMQTFEEMLLKMPFDKITVSALVTKCEISSNTFYYHYRDIYDLLDQWLDIKLSKYPTDAYLTDEWKKVVKLLLHDIQDHPDMINHVFHSISRERLERYVFTVLENTVYQMVQKRAERMNLSNETLQMLSGAFCYSLCGFVLKFIYNGMTADVDRAFDPIIDFWDNVITHYAEQKANNKSVH